MPQGYIYIMTNPGLRDMVKIGFSTDVEERRKQLSTTALPYEYEIFATYETSGSLEDRQLHKLIDNLNPDLRISKNREFFLMSAEDAYTLLESIAIISGTQDKLKRYPQPDGAKNPKEERRPAINFAQCGIPIGAQLVFVEDPTIIVTVESDRKVLYHHELTSLSAVAAKLKGCKTIQGSAYFSYNGRLVIDIANETQWKNHA